LCRWWYAIDWPGAGAVLDPPPKGYEPLDGYPGVYVCVKGAKIGSLLDNRDEKTAPSFSNLILRSTAELKDLLTTALQNQLDVLRKHEKNVILEKEIQKELTFVAGVKESKSDEFARKIEIKAKRLRAQNI
jgi:hypothetical protein